MRIGAGFGGGEANVADVALLWLAASAAGVTAARLGALVAVAGGGAKRGGGPGGGGVGLGVVALLHNSLERLREREKVGI